MPKEIKPGRSTTRRYSEEEKAQAVRLVRQLRRKLGTEHGTIQRVADQLGYGAETVRKWVKRADVDEGLKAGTSIEDRARILRIGGSLKRGHVSAALLAAINPYGALIFDIAGVLKRSRRPLRRL